MSTDIFTIVDHLHKHVYLKSNHALSQIVVNTSVNAMPLTAVTLSENSVPLYDISNDSDYSTLNTLPIFSTCTLTNTSVDTGVRPLTSSPGIVASKRGVRTLTPMHGLTVINPDRHLDSVNTRLSVIPPTLDSTSPHSAIFSEIDSLFSGSVTLKYINVGEKFRTINHADPQVNNLHLGIDSGYFSTSHDTTTGDFLTSPWSVILNMMDSQETIVTPQLHQIEADSPPHPNQAPVHVTFTPERHMNNMPDPPCCGRTFGTSPFTCAQRTCKELTFGYLTPAKADMSLTNLVDDIRTNHLFDSQSEQVSDSENAHDTTLDILESLDNSSINDTCLTPLDVTDNKKPFSQRKRIVMKARSTVCHPMTAGDQPSLRLSSNPITLSETPNKRSTKRLLCHTDIPSDLVTSRAKVPRSNTDLPITECSTPTRPVNTNLLDESVFPVPSDLTDFINVVTLGNTRKTLTHPH